MFHKYCLLCHFAELLNTGSPVKTCFSKFKVLCLGHAVVVLYVGATIEVYDFVDFRFR